MLPWIAREFDVSSPDSLRLLYSWCLLHSLFFPRDSTSRSSEHPSLSKLTLLVRLVRLKRPGHRHPPPFSSLLARILAFILYLTEPMPAPTARSSAQRFMRPNVSTIRQHQTSVCFSCVYFSTRFGPIHTDE